MEKQLFLRLRDFGHSYAEGKASIELTHIGTGAKTTLPLILFFTLPGAVRQIKIPIATTLPPGRYSAIAMVDYGQDEKLRIGQLDFTRRR
jgi:hypothetical protein